MAKLDDVKQGLAAKLEALEQEVRTSLNPRHKSVERSLALLAEVRANVQLLGADDGAGNGSLPA